VWAILGVPLFTGLGLTGFIRGTFRTGKMATGEWCTLTAAKARARSHHERKGYNSKKFLLAIVIIHIAAR